MLTIIKQSYLPYLVLTMIGSFFEGLGFCFFIGFYVTGILKVHIYIQ